ncbi:chemotaxis protein CheW [Azoarcus sp. KH32C]|uniref:chemotaxis protein CheW n=1 Tax=Azoarcus sp. KH32C TaxID=748247 RepID=UPI0002385B96|nr:chemotaxis protein CheW [Azoarcus sp. KH32C]BAL27273.1 chemotaxis signal transduction protein [Azoarcus sp. KH32C]
MSAAIVDCWNRIGVRGDRSCPELQACIHCRNCPVYAAAARRLLDAEMSDEVLQAGTQHVGTAVEPTASGAQALVLFRIGVEWLALSARVFDEIAGERPIHSLPNRRSGVLLGLANIRGELIVAFSLIRLLGIDPSHGEQGRAAARLLVLRDVAERAVCPVDEVFGLRRCAADELSPPPATVARAAAPFTRAVLSWEGRSVGVLDERLLFASFERSLA